ncbi:Choline transporter-like protein ctl1 [Choanephora cucurbitarum]|uniref:Protein PNS1 n=1 Tax=Choanephora cucurbitarum TaxID=101091 RepID=A0A1C7NDG6_9FUNG|nr:Choline transporter-like protein ctl1 [Choanephora cucurbitarum]
MEQSIPNLARDALSNLKNSFLFQKRGGYYAHMDQESEEEDTHSLFYSVHQNDISQGDSIPLTLSNAYSDRSQLLFDQEQDGLKPSAIYLDEPIGHSNTSLSDSLLPTSATIPVGISQMDKKYKDPIFAVLYIICFGIFFISGIILSLTTNSHAIEEYVKGSTFKTIKDSAGILTIIIATALIMGSLWLFILRTFTKLLVWGTVVCMPIALTVLFIWTLVESFHSYFIYSDQGQTTVRDTGLTIISFIPLLLNLIYMKLVLDHRHRITKTVSVIELACDVARYNPGIILVSMVLLVTFILFSILWLVFFNRLWLVGHLDQGTTWIIHQYVYSLAAFYVFMYIWTAKLLIYMERFCLSVMTAQWYFHRNEPSTANQIPWIASLVQASSTSLGTLALGSLILAIIQCLQLIAKSIRKYAKSARPLATVFSFILSYIDAIISTFSNYTISLAAITGENFFSAANSATKIFRRNLLTGLFGDLLTQLILYIGASVIALSSGLGAYVYATHQLHSPHGFIMGLLGTLMPWYLSQFFSYTMTSIIDASFNTNTTHESCVSIDASFLCYAIDLDTGTVHLSAAHAAFSGLETI